MTKKTKKLITLGDSRDTLEAWVETTGIPAGEILETLIKQNEKKIPSFLKPKKKEKNINFQTSKYDKARPFPRTSLYLGSDYIEALDNYKANTGEDKGTLIRNLIDGARKTSPHLFEKNT